MDLSRSLLKEFAEITNGSSQKKEVSKYVRGTITSSGSTKYVQIDGSSTLTPISEVVDVQDGDRVLVSIENHKATILGNFTFPPSARKEQEAIDKAENAQTSAEEAQNAAGSAVGTAQSASEKADQAILSAGEATTLANKAKDSEAIAIESANAANLNAQEAKEEAANASSSASTARQEAAAAQTAVSNAQAEVSKINQEIVTVKGDINTALGDLADQAAEIQATKETMELNYAKKNDVETVEATLTTEISKKVGELQTSIEQSYAAKTDIVDLEGKLQSQITQNADNITSTVSKVEKLESDTTTAQQQVDIALSKAEAAQTAATNAQTQAQAAQAAADEAKLNASTAQTTATEAQQKADAAQQKADAADAAVQSAQSDLAEAKQNLANVTNRVGATETEIADAQAKVDAAQIAVNDALADAAEANLAATNAQSAADQAKLDAEAAQSAATTAQQKADNAQAVADKAQSNALKAQEDVAALTLRVTTAETTITQNTGQIALIAQKTEEVGDSLINDYYNKVQADAAIKIAADEISAEVSKVDEKLVNDYYTKEQADAAIQLTADGITSTVSKTYSTKQEVKDAVDDISIGARNLIIRSTEEEGKSINVSGELETSLDYSVSDYIEITPNTEYMFSRSVSALSDGGHFNYAWYGTDKTYIGMGSNSELQFSWLSPDTAYFVRISYPTECLVKFEKGNKATDWTPAPEDMATSGEMDEVSSTVADSEEKISMVESSVQQLSDSISMLVTDEDGNSMMTQTSDGWRFDISAITTTLNDAIETIENTSGDVENLDQLTSTLESLVNDLAEKTAYIIMTTDNEGNPCIELGKEDNPFKVRITNTSVDFMEGSSKIAYVSNRSLFIETAVIKNEIKIGETDGFVWKTRSNGNMGLRWVEGVD